MKLPILLFTQHEKHGSAEVAMTWRPPPLLSLRNAIHYSQFSSPTYSNNDDQLLFAVVGCHISSSAELVTKPSPTGGVLQTNLNIVPGWAFKEAPNDRSINCRKKDLQIVLSNINNNIIMDKTATTTVALRWWRWWGIRGTGTYPKRFLRWNNLLCCCLCKFA